MSKHHNVIKKGKKTTFVDTIHTVAHNTINKAALITRQQMLDKFIITLGDLGYSKEDIGTIYERYFEIEQDYCDEVLTDSAADEDMWCACEHIDKLLKEYLPERHFRSYDERYNKW